MDRREAKAMNGCKVAHQLAGLLSMSLTNCNGVKVLEVGEKVRLKVIFSKLFGRLKQKSCGAQDCSGMF